ncbi:GEM interacting protein [Sarotherodon galilaeus]
MFTLTEVASLNDIQPTYRILKPWWDVFMDYLGIVMLMLAIFSGTMQLTKDQVVCLPILEQTPEESGGFLEPEAPEPTNGFWNKESAIGEQAAPLMAKRPPDSVTPTIHFTQPATIGQPYPTGVRTKLDFQQYVFVNQMCYHVALPWYSKYFPYLALIHTIVLMVSSNFWFKYPKTSSKVEHFVSILGKCFESPWTTKALSETACEDSSENKQRLAGASSLLKHLSTSSEEGSPNQSAPVLTKSGVTFSAEKLVSEIPSMTILDKKDGEQAKALFEKVRKFRAHVEDSDLIYRLYAIQTVIKTVKFILILCYTMTFVAYIDFDHVCEPEIKHLTGYTKFHCTHNMAFMLNKLLVSYIALICVYGVICIYTLFWLFRRPLKEYSFEKVREESSFSDIPDVKNDFAFLLHMVDQYDQLYSKRFGVFLSEVSENKLREISLNHEWTFDKLRQHVTRNPQDKLELHLFMLSGVPDAVFDLTDLEILKLELIPEAKITAKISQMINLQELHFYHCPAKVEQTAFIFLRDHLRCLHVKFTDVAEIPSWVYMLKNLRELYLVGNLNSENNKLIGLESLRDLRHLKILHLKSNLTKIPTNITDLSPHLLKLVIHNDGTKLLVLNSLKKMMNLAELELHNCELERIPHAIFSLNNLQELDLKSNNIRTIEEVISFQHLKRLTCLKLWHNKIITIPLSISHVKNLESLYLSHNKLESLPSPLFTLLKLRHLDVSHNSIVVIPPEALPKQLFKCTKLRTLCLGHNCISSVPEKIGQLSQLTHLELKGNCLDRLPAQLGQCSLLRRSCLIVEDHLFDSLPIEVKESINQETSKIAKDLVSPGFPWSLFVFMRSKSHPERPEPSNKVWLVSEGRATLQERIQTGTIVIIVKKGVHNTAGTKEGAGENTRGGICAALLVLWSGFVDGREWREDWSGGLQAKWLRLSERAKDRQKNGERERKKTWEGKKTRGTHDITPSHPLPPPPAPPLAVRTAQPFFIDSGMLDKGGAIILSLDGTMREGWAPEEWYVLTFSKHTAPNELDCSDWGIEADTIIQVQDMEREQLLYYKIYGCGGLTVREKRRLMGFSAADMPFKVSGPSVIPMAQQKSRPPPPLTRPPPPLPPPRSLAMASELTPDTRAFIAGHSSGLCKAQA